MVFTSRSSSEKSTYQCTFRTYLIFSSTYRRTYWMLVKTTSGYFEPLETLAKAKSYRFPSHCWGRWHDVLGLALNILPVLIPVEIWFIPGGGEEDKVPDQIDTVETISAGVITSELTWHWHTSGQECVVCVQFCFYRWC